MDNRQRLFFIALLPPLEIQETITEIKQHFATVYNSRAALKSPPHITLQPPFQWNIDNLPQLQQCLASFASRQLPVPISLSGFGAFPPRVIYIRPLKTPELITIQSELLKELEISLNLVDKISKNRPFSPHITVAFRDLTRQNFNEGWQKFKSQDFNAEFIASQVTLLIHNGKRWEICQEFPFF